EAPAGAARLAEQPLLGKVILRADRNGSAAKLAQAIGVELPVKSNTSSRSGTTTALWLGPDEWMLTTDPACKSKLLKELAATLSEMHHQLVDVSDAITVIELSGVRAREMLMKLTTLDLHPRAFRAGQVAGSRFGKTTATLHQSRDDDQNGGPAFELSVQSSMADYLWCLLAEAGREFGLPRQEPRAGETLRP
ncbi:MAG: sarcosine oxidase subunit gamma, partial [Methyloligellaceae bacterium]